MHKLSLLSNSIYYVCTLYLLAMVAGCGDKSKELSQDTNQPNVLFISVDDLNDWIGLLGDQGHSDVKTPNLDRLARRGVYFSNNHANVPVCTPSRLGVMTGLSAVSTGCYSNTSGVQNKNLWNETLALPALFRLNGYHTMACGKIEGHACYDIEIDHPEQKMWDERAPRSFNMTDDLMKDGDGYNGVYFYPFPKGGSPIKKLNPKYKGHSLCAGPIDRKDLPTGKMPDELSADWAIERLNRDYEKPFILGVGFVRPHVPYTAPQEFFDLYPINKINIPSEPKGELDDIPMYGKAMAYGAFEPSNEMLVRDLGPDYRKHLVQGYLACVSFLDAQVGKVLSALEESKYADNTIIVLWSDHGQHLGEKRSWRKNTLWEESTNSPMIWVVPGLTKADGICSQATSLMDIYPTLDQLCNLQNTNNVDGISLVPQLKNVETKRSTPAITSYSYGSHSVREERWHYIRYYNGEEELYDGDSDQGEHYNLANDPKYKDIIEQMKGHLPKDIHHSAQKSKTFKTYNTRADLWKIDASLIPEWLQ
ncbi:sulfatase [Carboxylicivirga sp. M1479]|uniref:sulfatase n=1 Tax=Carboxylicivirga sp. M1479 TaxID=2594476 RepID=UPI001177FCB7|nr:sulfatase [Carboxylicivirga sp. M1479]TRX71881.1 sulfatase [Carboxylicivirga sp. M1479]